MRVEEVGRGCETNAFNSNRESGFFSIASGKLFSFRPDWHQDERAKPIVRQYYTALDLVLESHPSLQACVVRCVHCGIRFVTHPCNAGRQDIRCPFGCREHHRRAAANARSVTHYLTTRGQENKERRNAARCRGREPERSDERDEWLDQTGAADQPSPDGRPPTASKPSVADESSTATTVVEAPLALAIDLEIPGELHLDGLVLDESSVLSSPMLPYVRMLTSLIEGVEITLDEMAAILRRALRQRSLGNRGRREYILAFLNRHPPWERPR